MRDEIFSFQKKEQTRGEITHKTQTLLQDSFSFGEQSLTHSLLDKYSHFYISQTSPFHSQIYSRGFGQNQILFSMDGISLNFSNYENGLLLNMIDASNFDKIELLYGNNSIQYGGNAIGGGIHFLSDKDRFTSENKWFSKGTLHFNSNTNALTPKISLGYSSKKIYTKLNFSAYCPRGYEIGQKSRENNTWGQELGVASWQEDLKQDIYKTSLNPYAISQSNFKLYQVGNQSSLKIGEENNINLGLYYNRLEDATQTFSTQNKEGFQYFATNKDHISLFISTLGFQFNKKQKLYSKMNVNIGFSNLDQNSIFRKYQSPYEKSINLNTSKLEFNIDAHKNFNWKWVLFYGINSKVESLKSSSSSISKTKDSSTSLVPFFTIPENNSKPTTIQSNTYLKIERRLDDKTALFAGINFGIQKQEYQFINTLPINSPNISFNKVRTSFNSQISWTRHSCENSNYAVSLFISSRMPDGYNISNPISTSIIIPNLDLKNEEMIGMEGHFYRKFDDLLELQIAPFAYMYKNKIGTQAYTDYSQAALDEDYKFFKRVNLPESFVLGANIDARYHFSKQWMGYFSINYNYGVQKDTQIYLDDIPPLYGNIGIKGNQGKFITHFWVNYNGAKPISFYNPNNELVKSFAASENNKIIGTPEFFILNMSCGYQFNKYIQANITLNNLFDSNYRKYMSGISGLGRNLQVSISFKL